MCIAPSVAWIEFEPYHGFRISVGINVNEVQLSSASISSNNVFGRSMRMPALQVYTLFIERKLRQLCIIVVGNVYLEQQTMAIIAQFTCPGARIVERWTMRRSREQRF